MEVWSLRDGYVTMYVSFASPGPTNSEALIQLAGMAVQVVSCSFTYPLTGSVGLILVLESIGECNSAANNTLSLVNTSHLTEPWKMRRFILVAPEVVRMKTTWTAANLFSDNMRLPRMH